MSDPVLDAHREAALRYIISGPQPISIRDQMLRGAVLVQRLWEATEIAPNRPLIVVGAGAGGATAALMAADLGVPTILVERGGASFQTQSLAYSRWLNPTQYDWPVDHSHIGRFPWQPFHPNLPLAFGSTWANVLALNWRVTLSGYVANHPTRLEFRTGREVASWTLMQRTSSTEQALEVVLDDGTKLAAGAAIQAAGVGFENCRVHDSADALVYEGQPFWGPDTFDSLRAADHTVLISGSGDGALQDYLRIVTHLPSAAAILANCRIPTYITHAIQSAEDRALRGRSWAVDDGRAAPYFAELEMVHRQQVSLALAQPQVLAGLHSTVPASPVRTHVVYRGQNITAYYGLNRFLTLLLSEFISLRDNRQTLFPGSFISAIRATDTHDCIRNGRAAGKYDATNKILLSHDCFERWHEVTFSGSSPPPESLYNVIVVRHGLLTPPKLSLQRPRHLLPYHFL